MRLLNVAPMKIENLTMIFVEMQKFLEMKQQQQNVLFVKCIRIEIKKEQWKRNAEKIVCRNEMSSDVGTKGMNS